MSEFAIVKTGGKQYEVKVGDLIKVEKIEQPKKTLEFDDILNNQKVTAEIIGAGKLDKIHIVKQHPKKRYKRVTGHRQNYTEIKITKIG